MNRHERRTKGKYIALRLQKLKNSPLLQTKFDDIPKETLDQLIEGSCPNSVLQKRYNLQKKLFDEVIRLEIELYNMKNDLETKKSDPAKKDV